MKKRFLFRVVAMLVLAIAGALSASAAGALTVSRTAMTSDSNLNYKHFEVQATTAGTHYAEFWGCPGMFEDGTYTKYDVYVNGQQIGSITPDKSGWQTLSVDGHPALTLKEGANVISVATAFPSIPDVETVAVADSEAEATIDHRAFDKYLADTKLGIANEPEDATITPKALSAARSSKLIMKGGNALRYTFHKFVGVEKGARLRVRTVSETPHVIEAIRYARPFKEDTSSGANIGIVIPPVEPEPISDKHWAVNLVDFEEMAEDSWSEISEYTPGSGEECTLSTERATEPLYYLVIVRTTDNSKVGVVDISIVGQEALQAQPISCTKFNFKLPKDDVEYITLTGCANQEEDDPMLFMYGANDCIIGMNDDGSRNWTNEFGLCKRDAVISYAFNQETTGVTVCNYSTLQPESTCMIISGIDAFKQHWGLYAASENKISMPEAVEIGSNLDITADEQIKSVAVYGVFGNTIGSVNGGDKEISVPISALNINKSGIYIVTVETESGVESGRLFVK